MCNLDGDKSPPDRTVFIRKLIWNAQQLSRHILAKYLEERYVHFRHNIVRQEQKLILVSI